MQNENKKVVNKEKNKYFFSIYFHRNQVKN